MNGVKEYKDGRKERMNVHKEPKKDRKESPMIPISPEEKLYLLDMEDKLIIKEMKR
jgi:hypothetical protein